ncbi:MAG TPA: hypothetical protein VEB43_17755 [Anaeromyxobacter sp.]|nr:hypothetical protein [Anaeromyxobacter sp.]
MRLALAVAALAVLTGCAAGLLPAERRPKNACPESQTLCFGAMVCSNDPIRGCDLCVCDTIPHGPAKSRK